MAPVGLAKRGRHVSLTRQSIWGAVIAAYVTPLVLFWFDLAWRIRTGADASMCGVDASTFCTIAEAIGAFLFTFLWALFGLPLALLVTMPCALVLGRLAPTFEDRFGQRTLGQLQYGLAAAVGVIAGFLVDIASFGSVSCITWVAGMAGGLCGAWAFRQKRYFGPQPATPS